ncbi:MAG: M48 family metalloprotease [Treponema sp.]|jgi:predicted Zn-dependent protease|nr:M48 family metalloprotease [Treponema sp.]
MKARVGIFVFIGIFVIVLSCGSAPPGFFGNLAGEAAKALGASEDVVNAARAGVGTLEESMAAADNLTPENEYYIGRAVAANVASNYKVYNGNRNLQVYLNKICLAIVINSPRPDIWNGYHVAILDSQEINAFATPGGHIFLTRGLIASADSEDALAAVIAHEVAHIQLRHGLAAIRNARYIDAFKEAAFAGASAGTGVDVKAMAGTLGDSVSEIVVTMVNNGYSKQQEFDADKTALSLLAAAGYLPASMLDMLNALQKNTVRGQGFGKTHPSPAERITNTNRNLRGINAADTREFRVRRFGAVPRT